MSEMLIREEYASLIDKRIIVGLTASSAIYRSIDLVRRLRRIGASVKVVMTRESLRFIGSDLVEWSSGSKPYYEVSGRVEHLELSKWADTLVVAPATLNTLSKIAYGVADELLPLLATTMLGHSKKVLVTPTMNIALYRSPQYRRVAGILEDMGVYVLPPFIEEDRVKYPPLDDLLHCVEAYTLRGRDIVGLKALVTAGPTREYIDPVRVITNPSSGLMGVLIAREILCRGGSVDLVHGPLSVEKPYMANEYPVDTTADMAHKISELTSTTRYDAAVFAAAPADFTPMGRSGRKISSRGRKSLTITLKPTLKTVKAVSKNNKPRYIVVFVAETTDTYDELVSRAREKLRDYGADMAIANNVKQGIGFSSNYIDACIVTMDHSKCYGVVHKRLLARRIVDLIVENMGGSRG